MQNPTKSHAAGVSTSASPAAESPRPDPSLGRAPPQQVPARPKEIGGPSGPEPTRYGDWEKKGRCIDF